MNFNNIPRVTKILLFINIAAFGLNFLLSNQNISLNRTLGVYYPLMPEFSWYQIITHMFMHAGIGHLFFNMFALWMFGSPIENYFGEKRFTTLYFVSGLGAFLLQSLSIYFEFQDASQMILQGNLANVPANIYAEMAIPMVGASGAIFGILAAFAVVYPNMPLVFIFIPIPIKAKYFIGIYFLIELFSGFSSTPGNVAHFAHVGGAIIGFFLTRTWMKNRYRIN